MAIALRRTNFSLERKVKICRYNIFHMIWKIIQKEGKTLQECVRFHVKPDLSFSKTDVDSVDCIEKKYHISLNSTGLVGAQGTLPLYLKEALLKAPKNQQEHLRVLYDLLQERSLQLAYTGWSRRRLITQAFNSNASTPELFDSLIGISNSNLPVKTINHDYRHYFVTFFSNPRRPQSALKQMLSEILGVPVNISSMQGAWMTLSPEQCTYLGKSTSSQLGRNTLCGHKIWSFQTKMRLVIGLISGDSVCTFLPDGINFNQIKTILSQYLNLPIQWDLQLLVDTDAIQSCLLTNNGWNRLGQSSFLGQLPPKGVCADIIFDLLQADI